LFITTCIEKQCTRPLNPQTGYLYAAAALINHRAIRYYCRLAWLIWYSAWL